MVEEYLKDFFGEGHFIMFSIFIFFSFPVLSFSISFEQAQRVSEKIWNNECNRSIEGLTHWNEKENFASLGIGHFIWYPKGEEKRFKETFPALIKFLENKNVEIPKWLTYSKECPWISREEFYQQINSVQMRSLRELLLQTKDLQAIYIAQQLDTILPKLLKHLSTKEEKRRVELAFIKLKNDSRGLYALIDYLNFKGEGISTSETYNGQGWGLLQVLQQIPHDSINPVQDFVTSAKDHLILRVKNSPSKKQEEKWLKGWLNRVETYLKN